MLKKYILDAFCVIVSVLFFIQILFLSILPNCYEQMNSTNKKTKSISKTITQNEINKITKSKAVVYIYKPGTSSNLYILAIIDNKTILTIKGTKKEYSIGKNFIPSIEDVEYIKSQSMPLIRYCYILSCLEKINKHCCPIVKVGDDYCGAELIYKGNRYNVCKGFFSCKAYDKLITDLIENTLQEDVEGW